MLSRRSQILLHPGPESRIPSVQASGMRFFRVRGSEQWLGEVAEGRVAAVRALYPELRPYDPVKDLVAVQDLLYATVVVGRYGIPCDPPCVEGIWFHPREEDLWLGIADAALAGILLQLPGFFRMDQATEAGVGAEAARSVEPEPPSPDRPVHPKIRDGISPSPEAIPAADRFIPRSGSLQTPRGAGLEAHATASCDGAIPLGDFASSPEAVPEADVPELPVSPSPRVGMTEWIVASLARLEQAVTRLDRELAALRTRGLEGTEGLNDRQRRALAAARSGTPASLTTRTYMELTGCGRTTAFRDLSDLVARGVILASGGKGSNAAYELSNPVRSRSPGSGGSTSQRRPGPGHETRQRAEQGGSSQPRANGILREGARR